MRFESAPHTSPPSSLVHCTIRSSSRRPTFPPLFIVSCRSAPRYTLFAAFRLPFTSPAVPYASRPLNARSAVSHRLSPVPAPHARRLPSLAPLTLCTCHPSHAPSSSLDVRAPYIAPPVSKVRPPPTSTPPQSHCDPRTASRRVPVLRLLPRTVF
jgi:hypothetical protein